MPEPGNVTVSPAAAAIPAAISVLGEVLKLIVQLKQESQLDDETILQMAAKKDEQTRDACDAFLKKLKGE